MKFSLQLIMSFHSYCLDIEKSSMEQDESQVIEDENNDASQTGIDEELISMVQQRPALYDQRTPSSERTKLKKKDYGNKSVIV